VAEKPVPAPELTHLHATISRDVTELRSRLARWTARRRAAGARQGIADRLGANPEDVITIAIRTFRAVRLFQDAMAGTPVPSDRGSGNGRVQESSPPPATHANPSKTRAV
jgi:hypothetical protein